MAYNIPYFRATLPVATGLVAAFRKYDTDTAGPDPTGGSRWFGTPASPRSDVIKSWEWWFAGSFLVPAAHASAGSGFTFWDIHTTSYDVGNTGSGGIGWGFGDLVSSVKYLYYPNTNKWYLTHQPNYPNHEFLIQTISRDVRYDFVAQVILGRLDQQLGLAGPGVSGGGIGNHPNNGYGRTRIWANGSNTPFDTGNCDNLQRSTNPSNGTTYTQTLFAGPWDGWYTGNLSTQVSAELSATRLGRSVGEALADGSVAGFTVLSTYTGDQGAYGTFTDLASISSSSFLVPSSLTGEPPPVVPPTPTSNFSPYSVAEQWNASTAVTDPPPDIPPTVVERNIGPWSTRTQWNAYGWLEPAPDPTSVTLTASAASVVTLTAKTPITVTITPVS